MLIPAFQLQLGHPIEHGQVCVGKYDGIAPSLTCATSAGKVCTPYRWPRRRRSRRVFCPGRAR